MIFYHSYGCTSVDECNDDSMNDYYELYLFVYLFVCEKIVIQGFQEGHGVKLEAMCEVKLLAGKMLWIFCRIVFFFGVHPLRMTTTSSSTLKHNMKRKNPCANEV